MTAVQYGHLHSLVGELFVATSGSTQHPFTAHSLLAARTCLQSSQSAPASPTPTTHRKPTSSRTISSSSSIGRLAESPTPSFMDRPRSTIGPLSGMQASRLLTGSSSIRTMVIGHTSSAGGCTLSRLLTPVRSFPYYLVR